MKWTENAAAGISGTDPAKKILTLSFITDILYREIKEGRFLMGRLFISIISAAAVFLFFCGQLSAADSSVDAPKKALIYNFNPEKSAGANTADAGDPQKNEAFEYLSYIIPNNMKTDMEKNGSFTVELLPEIPQWAFADARSETADFTDKLKQIAAEKGADFIITGFYTADKKNLSVECSIFVARTAKIIPVSAKSEIGVIIDAIIGNLSESAAAEIDKNILKAAPSPRIGPAAERSVFFEHIVIEPEQPGDEIWYTTDGSMPSREENDGDKYRGPFSIRRTADIRAVSYRDGCFESKPAEKKMVIRNPLSYGTVGFSFPSIVYTGQWGSRINTSESRGVSAYMLWEFVNFYGARNSFLFKNTGLYFGAESYYARVDNSSNSLTIMSGFAGIPFILRAADFLNFQLIPMGGASYTFVVLNDENGSGGPFGAAVPPENYFSKSLDPWAGCGLYANVMFSHLSIRLGVSYRRIFYVANPANAIGIESGFGIRF